MERDAPLITFNQPLWKLEWRIRRQCWEGNRR
jgi:hypothetical protein